MSETGFRMFNSTFSAGVELNCAVLFIAFFSSFIPARGRKGRKLLTVFSVYILFEAICGRAAFPQGSFGLILTALQEERASHFMECQQAQAIRARIHEAEQFYPHIRQLKHELRGHMTNITGLPGAGSTPAWRTRRRLRRHPWRRCCG